MLRFTFQATGDPAKAYLTVSGVSEDAAGRVTGLRSSVAGYVTAEELDRMIRLAQGWRDKLRDLADCGGV